MTRKKVVPSRKDRATSAWPLFGVIRYSQFAAALAVHKDTVRNYVDEGLIPPPKLYGRKMVGWLVEDAEAAIRNLPAVVQAAKEKARVVRRRGRPRKTEAKS